ncbi:MAG: helix-turn-helix transcriptional regulator [Limisphaerales bacterium]
MQSRLSAGDYFGTKRSNLRFDDLILSECSYALNTRLPKHSHENAYIIVVLEGSQVEELKEGRRWYHQKVLALHPAQEAHSQQIGSDGLRCLHVEFGANWLSQNRHVSRALERPAHFDTRRFPGMALAAASIRREVLDMDDLSQLAIEGNLLGLLAEINRSCPSFNGGIPAWLKKAREILQDRYREPLSLKAVSDSAGVHPVHLARVFRKHFRCTMAEYVRRLRIGAACDAIRGGNAPLSQIALETGFADQAHFTRVFKRLVGITPSQFRLPRNPKLTGLAGVDSSALHSPELPRERQTSR